MTQARSDSLGPASLQRLGFFPAAASRTIWVHGHSPDDFARAEGLLEELRAAHPRLRLACTSDQAETRAWLRRVHGDALVLPPPARGLGCARRHVKQLNPRVVIALESERVLGPALLERVAQRKVPVVVLRSEGGPGPRATSALVERYFACTPAAARALTAEGVPADKLTSVGGADAARVFRGALAPLLRRDLKALRHAGGGATRNWRALLLDLAASRPGRRLLGWRSERIDDLESLRRHLGDPQTILCLGNGPSSEDPRVREVAFDSLFRVNWQWMRRGILTSPDIVFTGDQRTVRTVPSCLFAFQTVDAEQRLLLPRLFDLRAPRIRYLTLERLPIFLNERHWDAKPTNGAAMLALAVALQPQRLVIAGIDLFQHPAGSYPGDAQTENAYTPRHDRDVELQIIEAALAEFHGEVVLLSDVLREKLDRRRAERAAVEVARDDAVRARASS